MNGKRIIDVLLKEHEGIFESLSARLGWPFIAEHDLWFHRAFRSNELRALLASISKNSDPESLAASGRLRRLLGDDAGAVRDLQASLDLNPSLLVAKMWLAEVGLNEPGSQHALSNLLMSGKAPKEARLHHALSCLLQGDLEACLDGVRRAPRSSLASLIEGEALRRAKKPSDKAFAEACRLEPTCAAVWLLAARSAKGAKRAELTERALDADPTYALITLSWHGPKARPGSAWRAHLERLLKFAFDEPERAGWYYRQVGSPGTELEFAL